jgi:hypothetical protein
MASLWLVVRAVGRDPDGDALFLKDGLSLLESRPYPFGDPAGTAGVIGGDGPRHGLAPGIDLLAERLEALDAMLAEKELDVVLEIGQLPEEGLESQLLGGLLAQCAHRPTEVIVQPHYPLDQQARLFRDKVVLVGLELRVEAVDLLLPKAVDGRLVADLAKEIREAAEQGALETGEGIRNTGRLEGRRRTPGLGRIGDRGRAGLVHVSSWLRALEIDTPGGALGKKGGDSTKDASWCLFKNKEVAVMRVRSRWFILSGALGGLVGFLLMEMFSVPVPGAGTFSGNLLRMSLYFAGFGLAVGAALGVTEGLAQRRPGRAIYGFVVGLLLGGAGGFVGGALGQAIYSLVPQTHFRDSTSDLAIALDSSGSMKALFFLGNDPWGERQSAAKNLIDRLSPTDRVAIVDFDEAGTVVHPLSFLGSETARETAKNAVARVDNSGGTDLSAGLDAAIGELVTRRDAERSRFIIFLTDGAGAYSSESAARARREEIKIYTVGLGDEVQTDLLQGIAKETGGQYYPVSDASQLTALFETIVREHGAMVETKAAESEGDPLLLLGLRILSWGAMGLLIGLGQGVRENTREDLLACGLGGFLGGALGGALFDPVVSLLTAGDGLAGRALADLVVGACIGGSMRLAQEKIVEASDKPGTTLISILPQKASSVTFRPSPAPQPPPRPVPVPAEPFPAPAPPLVPTAIRQEQRTAPAVVRPPLASFESGNDRDTAMVLARRAGYGLAEIGQHFGIPATTVKRVLSEKGV